MGQNVAASAVGVARDGLGALCDARKASWAVTLSFQPAHSPVLANGVPIVVACSGGTWVYAN